MTSGSNAPTHADRQPKATGNQPEWTRRPALLQGLRMLELPDQVAGFCGKLLADLGVEVIKLLPPMAAATQNASAHPLGKHPWIDYHDPGKRSITLNCEHPAGREI